MGTFEAEFLSNITQTAIILSKIMEHLLLMGARWHAMATRTSSVVAVTDSMSIVMPQFPRVLRQANQLQVHPHRFPRLPEHHPAR